MAEQAIDRVRYSHDAMIDILIAQPWVSQNELAKHFGYSAPWVSRVLNSDAFQARLAERKEELIDPQIVQSFEDRLKGLAATSLQIVQNKLDQNPGDAKLALSTLELTTKALGFGARDRNIGVQNNFVALLPEKAKNEAEWASTAQANVRQLAAEVAQRQANAAAMDVQAKVVSNG